MPMFLQPYTFRRQCIRLSLYLIILSRIANQKSPTACSTEEEIQCALKGAACHPVDAKLFHTFYNINDISFPPNNIFDESEATDSKGYMCTCTPGYEFWENRTKCTLSNYTYMGCAQEIELQGGGYSEDVTVTMKMVRILKDAFGKNLRFIRYSAHFCYQLKIENGMKNLYACDFVFTLNTPLVNATKRDKEAKGPDECWKYLSHANRWFNVSDLKSMMQNAIDKSGVIINGGIYAAPMNHCESNNLAKSCMADDVDIYDCQNVYNHPGYTCTCKKPDYSPVYAIRDEAVSIGDSSSGIRVWDCAKVDECSSGVLKCPNFSNCVKDNEGFKCKCIEGYMRRPHERRDKPCFNKCEPNPCKNGAQCKMNRRGQLVCACVRFYEGKLCDTLNLLYVAGVLLTSIVGVTCLMLCNMTYLKVCDWLESRPPSMYVESESSAQKDKGQQSDGLKVTRKMVTIRSPSLSNCEEEIPPRRLSFLLDSPVVLENY